MTSTLTPACPLCGLRYASKPLLELHIREDHRPRGRAQPGRLDADGTRASSAVAGSPSQGPRYRPPASYQVRGSSGAAAKRRQPGVAAAYMAAVLAFTYALLSVYWAAGGTAFLSTVGGSVEDIGRQGGLPAVALGLAAAALKLAGGILALALVRPWGRAMPRAWLLACATGASAVLACYGAVQVTAGSLVLSGAVHPAEAVDWTALYWHVLVWDMWFLIWGISLTTATWAAWRPVQAPRPGREPGRTQQESGLAQADPADDPQTGDVCQVHALVAAHDPDRGGEPASGGRIRSRGCVMYRRSWDDIPDQAGMLTDFERSWRPETHPEGNPGSRGDIVLVDADCWRGSSPAPNQAPG